MFKGHIRNELKQFRCWLFCLVGIFFLASLNASLSSAADKPYPDRPINLIVGFAPGGTSDLVATIMADKMAPILGQPLIRVYKPGGGGALSASFVKRAKPDGYTVLVVASTTFVPPEVRKDDYTFDDFIFTAIHTTGPYFMVVRSDSRWKNLKDFVDEAKKSPGKLTFGTAGVNTGGWFVYKILAKQAGIELTSVPFKSSGEAMTALLGGHIDSYFGTGVGAISEATLVRTLAIAEGKRLAGFSEVPTFTESGYPVRYSSFNGFALPKGTPEEIVDRITNAQKKAIEQNPKDIGETLIKVHMWPLFLGRAEALKEWKNVYGLIREIMKESGPAGK